MADPGVTERPRPTAVIDSSALVELVTRRPLARAVARAIATHELSAPPHIDAEVLGVIRKLWMGDLLTAAQADAAVKALQDAPVQRFAITPALTAEAWRLRHHVWAADGYFIALAALGSPDGAGLTLVTLDRGQAANYGRSLIPV